MYQTIEAKLDYGHLSVMETQQLPDHALVLVTVLKQQQPSSDDNADKLQTLLKRTAGIMRTDIDASQWQRNVRANDWK